MGLRTRAYCSRRSRWLGSVTLCAALLVSCQRKAPGPAECRAFALQVVGVPSAQLRENPALKAAVDEVTVRCLTTPFSRALLRCVEEGGRVRACLATYRVRALEPQDEPSRAFPGPQL